MGTETAIPMSKIQPYFLYQVKLNNPQMGTETNHPSNPMMLPIIIPR